MLEEKAAVIPDQLQVSKKDFEEFFNDVNELDTNEDGLAAEDGLMSDPLDTLRQAIVNLDEKELEEAENENEKKKLEEAEKNKKRQRGQRGQRGNN